MSEREEALRQQRETYIKLVTSLKPLINRISDCEDQLKKNPNDADFHLYVGDLYCQKAGEIKDNAVRKANLEKALPHLEIAKKHFTALNNPLGNLAATYADDVRYALAEIENDGTKKGNIILGIEEPSAAALQWLHLLYGEARRWKEAAIVAANYLEAHPFHEYPAMALAEGFSQNLSRFSMEEYSTFMPKLTSVAKKNQKALELILESLVTGDYNSIECNIRDATHCVTMSLSLKDQNADASAVYVVNALKECRVSLIKRDFPGSTEDKYTLILKIDEKDPEANLYFASCALAEIDLAQVGISGNSSETVTKCLDEAVKHCHNILEAAPEHPEANLYLARIHFSRRNWGSALICYNKAQEGLSKSNPKNPLILRELDARIWCEYKAGDLKSIPKGWLNGAGYATELILNLATININELRSKRQRVKHFGFDPLEALKTEGSYLSSLILEELKQLSEEADSGNRLNRATKRNRLMAILKGVGELFEEPDETKQK